jgi:hypothetical protein
MSNNQQQTQEYEDQDQDQQGGQQLQQVNDQQIQQPNNYIPPRAEGYRPAVIRESRIKDRPYKKMNDSLKIKIELDLEVEVDLYARVKGDGMSKIAAHGSMSIWDLVLIFRIVTIGLM